MQLSNHEKVGNQMLYWDQVCRFTELMFLPMPFFDGLLILWILLWSMPNYYVPGRFLLARINCSILLKSGQMFLTVYF